jgi:hypothetical protein
MVSTRLMELRKRRGLMITAAALTIGIPGFVLAIRLVLHLSAPHSNGPAGGFSVFTSLVAGVLYVFAFIVAATVGAAAGSGDLTDGMFRQSVTTGRSRVALYLARIPAGLAIVMSMVAVAFAIICVVCTLSAPNKFDFQGTTVPLNLSRAGYETWATNHPNLIICDLPYNGPCPGNEAEPTTPLTRAIAVREARQDYPSYAQVYLAPSGTLMLRTGLWIELDVVVAFMVALALASVAGQRALPTVLMIAYELVFRPVLLLVQIPHMANLQRSLVELAVTHFEPKGIGLSFGLQGPGVRDTSALLSESTIVAIIVISAWLAGCTLLGAWRMSTRDA